MKHLSKEGFLLVEPFIYLRICVLAILNETKKGSNSLNHFLNNNAPYTNSLNEETELRLQVK